MQTLREVRKYYNWGTPYVGAPPFHIGLAGHIRQALRNEERIELIFLLRRNWRQLDAN